MVSPKEVDISNLLTILSVIVAVGALITQTDKLRFRFCMSWYDYTLGIAVFLLIHYLVFAPVLRSLGFYYSFGRWKWGLDSTSAVYLILVLFSGYLFCRVRSQKISRGKIHIFNELVSNLILTKRFDELVLLVEPQLKKLISVSEEKGYFYLFYKKYYRRTFDMNALFNGQKQPELSKLDNLFNLLLDKIKVNVERSSVQASEVLFNLVTSPELTENLAVNHPYFGLKLLQSEVSLREDFISPYVDALLTDKRGRLYVELKNNQQMNGGSRLLIPKGNRLLHYFFSDAEVAKKNEVYRSIGESVKARIIEDDNLVRSLNNPLGSYYEVGKYRCPINSGISLFEIMVHEGIHQGLQDHLWLHYYYYFTIEILKKMVGSLKSGYEDEFPTIFHYLLYRMVSIATDWIEQCSMINEREIPQKTRDKEGFDKFFISKQATRMLGNMLKEIINSDKVSDQFKKYLLEIVVKCHNNLNNKGLYELSKSLRESVIIGTRTGDRHKNSYRKNLERLYQEIDWFIRGEAKAFSKLLDESIKYYSHGRQ